uniref:NADH dehydrogenase subunit 2 n=1 Tax=Dictyopteris divaricata TaxID=156996 RepID=A0A4Y5T7S4_9PHAE|nr:NADH dehydrogenase subunit 2 [Dictyopteris divaricata]QDB64133.1 NADH dehydrogenase subunit 2 [Dictyopteris divaricata]
MNKLNSLLFQVDVVSLLPEVFLALSFLVLLIYGSFQVIEAVNRDTYLAPSVARLTLVTLFLSLLLVFNSPILNGVVWNATFIVDGAGTSVKCIVLLSIFLCCLLAEEYLFLARIRPYEIFVFFLGVALSLCLLISSYDLLSIYLSIEFLSLIFYTLAAWKRDSGFSAEAGLKYFILGSLASLFFLFGSSLIYLVTGTTNLGTLSLLFDNLSSASTLSSLGFLFVISALLFKLGAAPYHMWVADVYEGAPTIITLLFASVPKFAIFVAMLRLIFISSWSLFPVVWESLFFSCGLLSLFFGCLGGLGEIKLKRVLAYSGIGHIGFLCLGTGCGSLMGVQSIFFYLFFYTLTSLYMWTYLLHLYPSKKNWLSIVDSVGLVQSNPILGIMTCLMLFSLAGIPPFGGFFSKMLVFASLVDGYFYSLALFAVFTSALSAFYYLRLIKILYFEKPKTWVFFCALSKSNAFVLCSTSFFVLFFMFSPNIFYLFAYKLGLFFFI